MKILQMQPHYMVTPTHFMYSVSAKLRPKLFSTSSRLRALCTISLNLSNPCKLIPASSSTAKRTVSRERLRARVKISDAQLKENWLASLSYPIPADESGREGDLPHINTGPEWVLGIDPDLSGALAVLKTDDLGCSAQVFDSPHLQVPVGKRTRRRLDVKSIVKLLQSFNAPIGTLAYLEQSIPFPQDGKQVCGSGLKTLLEPFSISVLNICFVILLVARSISFCSMKGWWSGGFGYGLWIGMLVASGFTVVPVPSFVWKNEFELYGNHSSKDDSRRVASNLFPSMSSLLKRKKDHGRAEALLIAAYGKDMKMKLDASRISDEMIA